MSNKLQELTDKIYQEGVARGNEEAENIIENAKKEANDILSKARKEAETIKSDAEKKAKETAETTESEIKLSAKQAISALKQEITNVISETTIRNEVSDALKDKEFVQKIIATTLQNWDKDKQGNLNLQALVTEAQEKEILNYFKAKTKELLDSGLEIKAGKHISAGFQIAPTDGGYKVSFTDDDFANFFKEYLRPKMIELLFGSK